MSMKLVHPKPIQKDALDAKKLYEREKGKQNIIIRRMQKETENALSFAWNITNSLKISLLWGDVMVYGAHRVD